MVPTTDEWITKRIFHTMEYYLSVRRNEVLILATTWMNLSYPSTAPENLSLGPQGLLGSLP